MGTEPLRHTGSEYGTRGTHQPGPRTPSFHCYSLSSRSGSTIPAMTRTLGATPPNGSRAFALSPSPSGGAEGLCHDEPEPIPLANDDGLTRRVRSRLGPNGLWFGLLALLTVLQPGPAQATRSGQGRVEASEPADPGRRRPSRRARSGIDGDPRKATPRLDALARQGVRFTRAYCNSPVCTPSRQSFITGRLPHAVGVTRLHDPAARIGAVTLGDWLGDLGYDDRRDRQDALQRAARSRLHRADRHAETGSGWLQGPSAPRAATTAGPGSRSTTPPPTGSTRPADRPACPIGVDGIRPSSPTRRSTTSAQHRRQPVRAGRQLLRPALPVQVPARVGGPLPTRDQFPMPRPSPTPTSGTARSSSGT